VCCSNHLARQVPWVSPSELGPTLDKTHLVEFNKVFPDIVRDLTHTGRHLEVPRATKWFAKVSPSPTVLHCQRGNAGMFLRVRSRPWGSRGRTKRSRGLFQKLIVAQQVKQSHEFFWNPNVYYCIRKTGPYLESDESNPDSSILFR
jgi:hypothetical protein